ncbi:hypothetical protein AAHE18_02G148100 [Arachis hypogaea]
MCNLEFFPDFFGCLTSRHLLVLFKADSTMKKVDCFSIQLYLLLVIFVPLSFFFWSHHSISTCFCWDLGTAHNNLPYVVVNGLDEDPYPFFPVGIVLPVEERWPVV